MSTHVLISGYVSMDRIVCINVPAEIGKTSIISNDTCATIHYGGCSVNIACALHCLGVKAIPLIRVGDDYNAIGFKRFLEDSNISMEGLYVVHGTHTSLCYLIQDKQHRHITLFYPGAMAPEYFQTYDNVLFENARYAIMTVASLEDNKYFLEQCQKYKVPLIFGMKCDFDAFPDFFLREVLQYSSIIFANESEKKMIESILHVPDITELIEHDNSKIIVITHGQEGSVYYHKKKDSQIHSAFIKSYRINKVIDTSGAGDAYMAGFIYGYVRNIDIAQCCRVGNALASFVVEKIGCGIEISDKHLLMNRIAESTDEEYI